MKSSSQDYWWQSRQPLNVLVFLAPLLAVYEFGVLRLGGPSPDQMRNGADLWMRTWLQQVGNHAAWLLPCLVVTTLLAWQCFTRQPWKISISAQLGMWVESLLFASCLVVVAQVQELACRQYHTLEFAGWVTLSRDDLLPRAISYVGAGIYEEVLFRLCLLPLCYLLLRMVLIPGKIAMVLAVIATSVLFSAAHYIGPSADQFALYSFIFRAIAGLFFAVLFVVRGFGVTAGCHATYDLLAGIASTSSPS